MYATNIMICTHSSKTNITNFKRFFSILLKLHRNIGISLSSHEQVQTIRFEPSRPLIVNSSLKLEHIRFRFVSIHFVNILGFELVNNPLYQINKFKKFKNRSRHFALAIQYLQEQPAS